MSKYRPIVVVLALGLLGVGIYQTVQGTVAFGVFLIGLSLLAGGRLLFSSIWGAETEAVSADSSNGDEHVEGAPWRARPEWRTDTLTHGHDAFSPFSHANEIEWGTVAGGVLVALVFSASGGLIFFLGVNSPDKPLAFTLIGAFMIGGGLLSGWVTARKILRQYKFGSSRLKLKTMPARPGGRFYARLRVPISSDEVRENKFTAELACKRQYLAQPTEDAPKQRVATKWVDEIQVEGRPRLRGDEQVLEVPITFDLPDDQPPSTPEKKTDRILWELTVTADLSGVNYKVSFEVPVFDRERESSPGGVGSEEIKAARERSAERLGRDRESLRESEKVHVEGTPGDGLRVEVRPGGDLKGIGLPFLIGVPAAVVGAALLAVPALNMILLGVLLLPMGGLLLYVGLRQYTYSGEVRVEDGDITVRRGAFGFWKTSSFSCSMLEDASVIQRGRAAFGEVGDHRNYVLTLKVADSSLADGSGNGTAKDLLEEMDSRETDSTVLGEALKRNEDFDQRIKVGENIKPKEVGDRAAEAILEAAERQTEE